MDQQKEYTRHLNDEERAKVLAQVDYFVHILSERYDVSPHEVIDTIRWVRERKEFASKVKSTSAVSLLGILLSALALAIWEGIKTMVVIK